ncbi:MAG: hypothetical protein EXS05_02625 [Planctomycetaceae bacterium]|nr:hypothetical protein [Planctomycetaceae bacterium]
MALMIQAKVCMPIRDISVISGLISFGCHADGAIAGKLASDPAATRNPRDAIDARSGAPL